MERLTKERPMIAPFFSLMAFPPVHGLFYLDPGTGSYLLQILLAAGMSLLFFLGIFRKKIAAFFFRLLGRPPADHGQDDGNSDDD
jgi:hypothetical protein